MVPWELKWTLSGGRLDFQVDVRVSDAGQAAQRTPSVQRARARVRSCVFRRIDKSPCCPGNESGPLAVAAWIYKVTSVFCAPDVGQAAQRTPRVRASARARAGGKFSVVQKKVATLPWELKWPFSGGRFDFQVNLCFFQMSATRRSVRRAYARAHAGGEFCIVQSRKSRNDAPGN